MTNKNPPVLKQVAGALVGATLSLALYQGWKTTSPHLTGWLTVPETTSEDPVEISDENGATVEQFERIARRAREISMKFENVHPAPTDSTEGTAPIAEAVDDPVNLPTQESVSSEHLPMDNEEDLYPNDEPKEIEMVDMPIEELPNEVTPEPVRYPSVEEVVHPEVKAPSLPSSGVGVLAGGIAVLGAATGWLRSRKKGRV